MDTSLTDDFRVGDENVVAMAMEMTTIQTTTNWGVQWVMKT